MRTRTQHLPGLHWQARGAPEQPAGLRRSQHPDLGVAPALSRADHQVVERPDQSIDTVGRSAALIARAGHLAHLVFQIAKPAQMPQHNGVTIKSPKLKVVT